MIICTGQLASSGVGMFALPSRVRMGSVRVGHNLWGMQPFANPHTPSFTALCTAAQCL